MGEKTATFGIKVEASSNASAEADAVERFRAAISRSQDAVKSYNTALRSLRGTSDEVAAARVKLKGARDAERDAISRATLSLGKEGTTFEGASKRAAEHKKKLEESFAAAEKWSRHYSDRQKAADKTADATKNVSKALSAVGGPAAEVAGKLDTLKNILGGAGGAAGLAAGAVALAAAAIAALTGAVIAGAVALGRFVLEEGNALRTMSLFREAATGSAANAKAFGHQIDALASKIATPRTELNELSVSLSRALEGTRVSGKGIIDTFDAVAQTSAAMGAQAGSAIESIVTRSKTFGRLGIGRFELQGTGLQLEDVAGALSKNLKIGIDKAKQQLLFGRVAVDDGAKALRDAVEKRFGAINARRLLDLNVIAQKFHETLQSLTEDVNIEPVLTGFDKLRKLFDKNTVTGQALKQIVTSFGTVLGKAFTASLPYAEKAFHAVLLSALKLEVAGLRLTVSLKKAFGGDALAGLNVADNAFSLVVFSADNAAKTIEGLGRAVEVVGGVWRALGATVDGVKRDFGAFVDRAKATFEFLTAVDLSGIGRALIDGLIEGLTAGAKRVAATVGSIADTVKGGFKGALGIHSPSLVFKGYGVQTVAGYKAGVEAGAPQAKAATAGLAGQAARGPIAPQARALPLATGAAGGGGGAGHVEVTVHAHFPNARSGEDVTAALKGASFLAQLTKAIEEHNIGAGIPSQGSAT